MSRHFAYKAGPGRVQAAATAALMLVAGLFAASVATPSEAAPPTTTTPTTLTVSVTTDNTVLAGAPDDALPTVLAAKNSATLQVTITVDGGVELNKGTAITLSPVVKPVTGSTRKPAGSFSPTTFMVPSRGSSWTILDVSYSAQDADIALLATVKKTPTIKGQSAYFDILDTLDFAYAADDNSPNDDAELRSGFGATDCTSTSTSRVCGIVVLPQGIASQAAALSNGVCFDTNCNGAEEVQFIAGLSSLYTAPNAPATLILRCDKATCKGKGVTSYTAKISLSKSGGLIESPACLNKTGLNTYPPLVPATESTPAVEDPRIHFCTDYVASHRDNASDLLMEVRFDKDMRGTM